MGQGSKPRVLCTVADEAEVIARVVVQPGSGLVVELPSEDALGVPGWAMADETVAHQAVCTALAVALGEPVHGVDGRIRLETEGEDEPEADPEPGWESIGSPWWTCALCGAAVRSEYGPPEHTCQCSQASGKTLDALCAERDSLIKAREADRKALKLAQEREEQARKQRDEAQEALADMPVRGIQQLRDQVARLTVERDEARKTVGRLQEAEGRLIGWLGQIDGGDNPCDDAETLRVWAMRALRGEAVPG